MIVLPLSDCTVCGDRGLVDGCPSCLKKQYNVWKSHIVMNDTDPIEFRDMKVEEAVSTNGGPSLYYDFPEGAITLNDLIEYKDMGFHRGNIFKACWRMGTKKGTTEDYDMRKIVYSGLRMLKKEVGADEVQRYLKELTDDPQFR